MDGEANSHRKVVGMFIIKAKVTAHIACAHSLMSQEPTTIFHTEVDSTGCRREEQRYRFTRGTYPSPFQRVATVCGS